MSSFKFVFDRNKLLLESVKLSLKKAGEAIKPSEANKVGRTVIAGIKDLTASGISPLRGGEIRKRFEGYRGTYKERISKGNYKGKTLRPVNLRLTGEFIDDLKYVAQKSGNTTATEIGFKTKKSQDKEQGHRNGTNGQAKRPIIPEGSERFTQTIENEIEDIYEQAVEEYLKKQSK